MFKWLVVDTPQKYYLCPFFLYVKVFLFYKARWCLFSNFNSLLAPECFPHSDNSLKFVYLCYKYSEKCPLFKRVILFKISSAFCLWILKLAPAPSHIFLSVLNKCECQSSPDSLWFLPTISYGSSIISFNPFYNC